MMNDEYEQKKSKIVIKINLFIKMLKSKIAFCYKIYVYIELQIIKERDMGLQ